MKRVLAIVAVTLGTFIIILNIRFAALDNDPVIEKPDAPDYSQMISPLPDVKEATLDTAVASITEKELKDDLYYLASQDLEGRMSGKKGNITAAAHIKAKFESFGLPTMYDKFPISRLNPGPKNETGDDFTQNIYAWIEGSDPVLKNEVVVVGAHMDHIGYGPSMSRASGKREVHPGADDNASGTVALMEIAQAMSMMKSKIKRTIVFQAYSAEEMGLIGSRHYCDNPKFPLGNPSIKSHVCMINMDMIGYLKRGHYFAGFDQGDSSIDLGAIIKDLNNKYTFANQITSRGSGGSDHACFYNKKVPVAFLHTGLHAYYHTPGDTPDKINYNGVEQVARYAFELSWRVASNETAPRFNHASYKELPYDHDHGHPDQPFIHSYHKHGDHGHSHE